MFLAGFEFFLGLVCGSFALSAVLFVFMVVVEHVTSWTREDAKACIPPKLIEELENDALRRSGVIVIVRASEWKSKSAEETNRRTRSIQ